MPAPDFSCCEIVGGTRVKTVFVVGAGPAGMFAAQKIAQGGHEVIILNRDIKPGGLAEYGIYPTKDKMKVGLRRQFAKVLSLPNVYYFGHVPVSGQAAVCIADLQQFGPSAIVFAIGAQGTKKLGFPAKRSPEFMPPRILFTAITCCRHLPRVIFPPASG